MAYSQAPRPFDKGRTFVQSIEQSIEQASTPVPVNGSSLGYFVAAAKRRDIPLGFVGGAYLTLGGVGA